VGNKDVAMVYVLDFGGKLVECVEAVQPPKPRAEKWVLMISTLYGCPVGCQMCDAGGHYHGPLGKTEMLQQIEYLISTRYPKGSVPCSQFKIQFARMGEPSFNPAVLDLLAELPFLVKAPGLMPSLSTIAPHGRQEFFDRLIEIKDEHYANGNFQMQFSIHTTDSKLRDEMLPVKKWNFAQIAEFGQRFFQPGDRKITLNFALAQGSPVDPAQLREHFEPDKFLVKLTPLNPTYRAEKSGLKTFINGQANDDNNRLIHSLERVGFQVIVSIGELEENEIGSNCGQYVLQHINQQEGLSSGYSYPVLNFSQAIDSKD
jgi:23S rRNA (adenine2503-C2)-methyltransferase